jgi:hypothetical protein
MTVRQQSADSIRKEIEKENKVASKSVYHLEIIGHALNVASVLIIRGRLEELRDWQKNHYLPALQALDNLSLEIKSDSK